MGRVFTWEQVKASAVPSKQAFDDVGNSVRVAFTNQIGIHFATFIGSYARGTTNVRSDIDCLVVYEHKHHCQTVSTMQYLVIQAARQHIPLEFIPIDITVAATRGSHVGPSFLAHTARCSCAGATIQGSMPAFCHTGKYPLHEEIIGYLRMKLYRLEEDRIKYPSLDFTDRARALKRSLEAPIHVARKVLDLLGVHLTEDGQGIVRQGYQREIGSMGYQWLGDLLESLSSLDQEYLLLLNEILAGGGGERWYNKNLDNLFFTQKSSVFVRENILLLDNKGFV